MMNSELRGLFYRGELDDKTLGKYHLESEGGTHIILRRDGLITIGNAQGLMTTVKHEDFTTIREFMDLVEGDGDDVNGQA